MGGVHNMADKNGSPHSLTRCARCGSALMYHDEDHVLACAACGHRHYRPLPVVSSPRPGEGVRECAHCGRAFSIPRKRSAQQHCSQPCAQRARQRAARVA